MQRQSRLEDVKNATEPRQAQAQAQADRGPSHVLGRREGARRGFGSRPRLEREKKGGGKSDSSAIHVGLQLRQHAGMTPTSQRTRKPETRAKRFAAWFFVTVGDGGRDVDHGVDVVEGSEAE